MQLEAILNESQGGNWKLTQITPTLYHASAPDKHDLAVKIHKDAKRAAREFAILQAIRDFGVDFVPEAIAVQDNILITAWVEGETLSAPPPVHDEDSWHRLMAAMGVTAEMNMTQLSRQIPMEGRGYMRPGDLMDDLQRLLTSDHPHYERLKIVLEKVREQVAPDWNMPAPVGLCRCDASLRHFMQVGCCQIMAMDWEQADWGDIAAELGLWSVHPDFEEVPQSHWVWVRWEFARLQHQSESMIPRATVYARLGIVKWAILLGKSGENPKQAERYLKRAEKEFRV